MKMIKQQAKRSMKKTGSLIMLGIFLTVVASTVSTSIGQELFPKLNLGSVANVPRKLNISLFLLPGIVAPVIEEYIFRIKLLPWLNKFIKPKYAMILSSLLFSAMHMQVYFIPYFLNSMIYSWIAMKTKNKYASILVHAGYNSLALGSLFM